MVEDEQFEFMRQCLEREKQTNMRLMNQLNVRDSSSGMAVLTIAILVFLIIAVKTGIFAPPPLN